MGSRPTGRGRLRGRERHMGRGRLRGRGRRAHGRGFARQAELDAINLLDDVLTAIVLLSLEGLERVGRRHVRIIRHRRLDACREAAEVLVLESWGLGLEGLGRVRGWTEEDAKVPRVRLARHVQVDTRASLAHGERAAGRVVVGGCANVRRVRDGRINWRCKVAQVSLLGLRPPRLVGLRTLRVVDDAYVARAPRHVDVQLLLSRLAHQIAHQHLLCIFLGSIERGHVAGIRHGGLHRRAEVAKVLLLGLGAGDLVRLVRARCRVVPHALIPRRRARAQMKLHITHIDECWLWHRQHR